MNETGLSLATIDMSQFIDEVKKHPELYDKTLDVDRDEKIACWKQIGAEIFRDWNTYSKAEEYDRVLGLQRKWRSIRDQLNRELRFRKIPNRRRKVYRYFNKLKFLLKDQPDQGDDDNEDDNNEDYDNYDCQNNDSKQEINDDCDNSQGFTNQSQELNQTKSEDYAADVPQVKIKRNKPKTFKIHTESKTLDVSVPNTESNNPDKESDRLFLMSFVDEMAKLPSNLKMRARAEIARIMQEAVSRNYPDPLSIGQLSEVNVKLQRADDELM